MTPDDPFVEQLTELEDRANLWDLVCRYAIAIDDEEYDTLEGLFAERAELIGRDGQITRGRREVVGYLRRHIETAQSSRVHTPTSQLVSDKSKEAARGLVSCYAAITDQLGELTFFAFRYDDRYVREGGHWRFARRHIHHTTGILPHSGLSS